MDCPDISYFDIKNWRDVPAVYGRLAVEEDIRKCRATFLTGEGQSEPDLEIKLPALANWTDEIGTKHPVILVQIQKSVSDSLVIVGYRDQYGGTGAGTLPEFEIIETAD